MSEIKCCCNVQRVMARRPVFSPIFRGLQISNFFLSQIVLLDETLISVKFQDEHRHGSGDIKGWKYGISKIRIRVTLSFLEIF